MEIFLLGTLKQYYKQKKKRKTSQFTTALARLYNIQTHISSWIHSHTKRQTKKILKQSQGKSKITTYYSKYHLGGPAW